VPAISGGAGVQGRKEDREKRIEDASENSLFYASLFAGENRGRGNPPWFPRSLVGWARFCPP